MSWFSFSKKKDKDKHAATSSTTAAASPATSAEDTKKSRAKRLPALTDGKAPPTSSAADVERRAKLVESLMSEYCAAAGATSNESAAGGRLLQLTELAPQLDDTKHKANAQLPAFLTTVAQRFSTRLLGKGRLNDRWREVVDLLSPARQATEPSPFSYRTLEMLAALSGDDRRAQAVNNGHLTSTVLQVIQMLSEWTPAWEAREDEMQRKRAGADSNHHVIGIASSSSMSVRNGGPQSVLKPGSKKPGSGRDSDDEEDDFMFLRPTPGGTPSTLSAHASLPSSHVSEADDYERLSPSEKIAVVMTSLGRFIKMMVRFPSTAAELVRSNSLIILFKMAVATGAITAVPATPERGGLVGMGHSSSSSSSSYSSASASLMSPSGNGSDLFSASEWQFRDAAQQLGRSCLLALVSGRPAEDVKTAGYFHRTGCLRILLEALRRPHELGGPTSIVDLVRVIVTLLQHAGVSTPQLLTDVNEAEAYDIFFDCALWLAVLADPNERSPRSSVDEKSFAPSTPSAAAATTAAVAGAETPRSNGGHANGGESAESKLVARSAEAALSGLLASLNEMTFVGPDILQLPPDHSAPANHMGRSEFEEMGLRVRNLNAFRVLQFAFVRIASPMVRMDILNRVLMIFSAHPDNFWLLHELHPLAYFIEMMPVLHADVQQLVLKLLEYVICVVGTIPSQEIHALISLLRIRTEREVKKIEAEESTLRRRNTEQGLSQLKQAATVRPQVGLIPSPVAVQLILYCVREYVRRKPELKDTMRDAGLLEVLVEHFRSLGNWLDRSSQPMATTQAPTRPLPVPPTTPTTTIVPIATSSGSSSSNSTPTMAISVSAVPTPSITVTLAPAATTAAPTTPAATSSADPPASTLAAPTIHRRRPSQLSRLLVGTANNNSNNNNDEAAPVANRTTSSDGKSAAEKSIERAKKINLLAPGSVTIVPPSAVPVAAAVATAAVLPPSPAAPVPPVVVTPPPVTPLVAVTMPSVAAATTTTRFHGRKLSSNVPAGTLPGIAIGPLLLNVDTYKSGLRTLAVLLEDSPSNLRAFRDAGGAGALYSLLRSDDHRLAALRLLVRLPDHSTMSALLELLQATRTQSLQADLLEALNDMMIGDSQADRLTATQALHAAAPGALATSAAAAAATTSVVEDSLLPFARVKDLWRELNGFESVFAVVATLSSTTTAQTATASNVALAASTLPSSAAAPHSVCLPSSSNGATPATSMDSIKGIVLSRALLAMRTAISHNPHNRHYLWSHGSIRDFALAIKVTGVLSTAQRNDVLQSFADLATEYAAPFVHTLDELDEPPQQQRPLQPESKEKAAALAAAKEKEHNNSNEPHVVRWLLDAPTELKSLAHHSHGGPGIVVRSGDALCILLQLAKECGGATLLSVLRSCAHLLEWSERNDSLHNLQSVADAGLLTFMLQQFPTQISAAMGTNPISAPSTTTLGPAPLGSSTNVAMNQSIAEAVLRVVESIAAFSASCAQLQSLVRLLPNGALHHRLLRLLLRGSPSTPFVSLDTASHGYACLEMPSISRAVTLADGFTITCWANIRRLPVSAKPDTRASSVLPKPPSTPPPPLIRSKSAIASNAHIPGATVSTGGPTDLLAASNDLALVELWSGESSSTVPVFTTSIREDGVLTVSVLQKDGKTLRTAAFDAVKLRPKRWYHLAISHERGRLGGRSALCVHVDGRLVGIARLSYAHGVGSASLRGIIGTSPARTGCNGNHGSSWWLGPFFLLSNVLHTDDIRSLRQRGPSYGGTMLSRDKASSSSSASAPGKKSEKPSEVKKSGSNNNLTGGPSGTGVDDESTSHIASRDVSMVDAEKIVLSFHPSHHWSVGDSETTRASLVNGNVSMDPLMAVALRAKKQKPKDTAAALTDKEAFRQLVAACEATEMGVVLPNSAHCHPTLGLPAAFLSGGAMLLKPINVADSIRAIGGMTILFPLLERAQTASQLSEMLALLVMCLDQNPKNLKTMARLRGYELVALVLRDKAAQRMVNNDALHVLFGLVEGHVSMGVIARALASSPQILADLDMDAIEVSRRSPVDDSASPPAVKVDLALMEGEDTEDGLTSSGGAPASPNPGGSSSSSSTATPSKMDAKPPASSPPPLTGQKSSGGGNLTPAPPTSAPATNGEHKSSSHVATAAITTIPVTTTVLVIANPLALQHLLLDFYIWRQTTPQLQRSLLWRLAELCCRTPAVLAAAHAAAAATGFTRNAPGSPSTGATTSSAPVPLSLARHALSSPPSSSSSAAATINAGGSSGAIAPPVLSQLDLITLSNNAARLRKMGVTGHLLHIASDPSLPPEAVQPIGALVEALMLDKIRLRELHSVATFLVSGLGGDQRKAAPASSSSSAAGNRAMSMTLGRSAQKTLAKALAGGTTIRGFLLRTGSIDADYGHITAAPVGVQVASAMFQALYKVVMALGSSAPIPDGAVHPLDPVIAMFDLHWFSLFLWPDVHPHVVSGAMKLMSALLCGNARFKSSFLQVTTSVSTPVSLGGGVHVLPMATSNVATGGTAASSSSSSSSSSTTGPSPGFQMLMERLPFCRPSWEVYAVLFGLMLGKTAGHFEIGPRFDLLTLTDRYMNPGESAGEKGEGKSNNVIFGEALAVLLALMREAAGDLWKAAQLPAGSQQGTAVLPSQLPPSLQKKVGFGTPNSGTTGGSSGDGKVGLRSATMVPVHSTRSGEASSSSGPSTSSATLSGKASKLLGRSRALGHPFASVALARIAQRDLSVAYDFLGVLATNSEELRNELSATTHLDMLANTILFLHNRFWPNQPISLLITSAPPSPSSSPLPSPRGGATPKSGDGQVNKPLTSEEREDRTQCVAIIQSISELMSTLLLSAISSQPAVAMPSQDKIRRILESGWSAPSYLREQLMTLHTTILSLTLDRLRGMLGLRVGHLSVASHSVAELLMDKPRAIPNFDVLWTVLADKLESGHLVLPLTEPVLSSSSSGTSGTLTAASASAATSWGRLSVWQVCEAAMQLLRLLAVFTGDVILAPPASVRSVTERITGTPAVPNRPTDDTGEEVEDHETKRSGFFSRNRTANPKDPKDRSHATVPAKRIASLKGAIATAEAKQSVVGLRRAVQRMLLHALPDLIDRAASTVTNTTELKIGSPPVAPVGSLSAAAAAMSPASSPTGSLISSSSGSGASFLTGSGGASAASSINPASTPLAAAAALSALLRRTAEYGQFVFEKNGCKKSFIWSLCYHLFHCLQSRHGEVRMSSCLVWESILKHQLAHAKEFLTYKIGKKPYDLLTLGFGLLLSNVDLGPASTVPDPFHRFGAWFNANQAEIEEVFKATVFDEWRTHLALETKSRIESRTTFTNRCDEQQAMARVRRRALHEKRNELARDRDIRAADLQERDLARDDARKRELHYQHHTIRRDYRTLSTMLKRQGLMLLTDDSQSQGVFAQVNDIPKERWRLDATEGPFRQRKKLEPYDDFYPVYEVDLQALHAFEELDAHGRPKNSNNNNNNNNNTKTVQPVAPEHPPPSHNKNNNPAVPPSTPSSRHSPPTTTAGVPPVTPSPPSSASTPSPPDLIDDKPALHSTPSFSSPAARPNLQLQLSIATSSSPAPSSLPLSSPTGSMTMGGPLSPRMFSPNSATAAGGQPLMFSPSSPIAFTSSTGRPLGSATTASPIVFPQASPNNGTTSGAFTFGTTSPAANNTSTTTSTPASSSLATALTEAAHGRTRSNGQSAGHYPQAPAPVKGYAALRAAVFRGSAGGPMSGSAASAAEAGVGGSIESKLSTSSKETKKQAAIAEDDDMYSDDDEDEPKAPTAHSGSGVTAPPAASTPSGSSSPLRGGEAKNKTPMVIHPSSSPVSTSRGGGGGLASSPTSSTGTLRSPLTISAGGLGEDEDDVPQTPHGTRLAADTVIAEENEDGETLEEEEANGEEEEKVEEWEQVRRLLEPGDEPLGEDALVSCARVSGLDRVEGLLVLCQNNLYVIDNFRLNGDQLTALDPVALDKENDPAQRVAKFTVAFVRRPVAGVTAPLGIEDQTVLRVTKIIPKLPEPVLVMKAGAAPANGDYKTAMTPTTTTTTTTTTAPMTPTPGTPMSPLRGVNPSGFATLTAEERLRIEQDNKDKKQKEREKEEKDKEDRHPCRKWSYQHVREVHPRRYQLVNVGMEVFHTNGLNMLLCFDSKHIRDTVYNRLMSMELSGSVYTGGNSAAAAASQSTAGMLHWEAAPQPQSKGATSEVIGRMRVRSWKKAVTARWQNNELSNFAYLMFINTLAGRSYNDLTQYPVFPWILSDYHSDTLDLENPLSYRDLSKPMGAIGVNRAAEFHERFQCWDDPSGVVPKFHYGTHYSSAGGVLYYLTRLEPFTKMALQLQGGKFDHGDRLFHDIGHSWHSASSSGGLSDVKELVPEFFYLPDFLRNTNCFDLGSHQTGSWVGDVGLPPWAKGNPHLFIRLHRQALESKHVSANLHHWIDLIFGAKQRGKNAELAQNVFYYLTYEDAVDVNAISDPVLKMATIAQINNFGQTPHQVFKKLHVKRKELATATTLASHTDLLRPSAQPVMKLPRRVCSLFWLKKNEKLFALDENKAPVPPKYSKYISWGHIDCSLRFCTLQPSPRHRTVDEVVAIHEDMHDGQISVALVTDDGQQLITGGVDSVVSVWRLDPKLKHRSLALQRNLCGHTATITTLIYSAAQSILLTGSLDRTVSIWDLNRLVLIRRLPLHPYPIAAVAINHATGEIVTCAGSHLFVWTVNGELVASHRPPPPPTHSPFMSSDPMLADDVIESVAWSKGAEWIEDNVVITGHRDGHIRFWRLIEHTNKRSAVVTAALASGPDEIKFQAEKDAAILAARMPVPMGIAATLPIIDDNGGWMRLQPVHEAKAHDSGVCSIHAPATAKDKLWTGDRSGAVVSWALSSDEHWVRDIDAKLCKECGAKFGILERRHHCRVCGGVFCRSCSSKKTMVPQFGYKEPVRVCDNCYVQQMKEQMAAKSNATAAAAKA